MSYVIISINPGKRVHLRDGALPDTCRVNRPRRRRVP